MFRQDIGNSTISPSRTDRWLSSNSKASQKLHKKLVPIQYEPRSMRSNNPIPRAQEKERDALKALDTIQPVAPFFPASVVAKWEQSAGALHLLLLPQPRHLLLVQSPEQRRRIHVQVSDHRVRRARPPGRAEPPVVLRYLHGIHEDHAHEHILPRQQPGRNRKIH